MSPSTKLLIERAGSWPVDEELADCARDIGARRSGVYQATPAELEAIDQAERSGVATDKEIEAAFQSFRGP